MRNLFLTTVILFFTACSTTSPTEQEEEIQTAEDSWYKPTLSTTWQWQLQGALNHSYDIALYDIDLFDTDAALIASLQASGKKVICYFSAGSFEDWRDDASSFPQSALGSTLDGWAGEKWLDITDETVRSIMKQRLDLAHTKGCDGVEPDNVDGYTNDTGFTLTSDDQLNYNIFLAQEAHKRALSIGLKNDLDQAQTLEPYFDFSVNEQCYEYNECTKLNVFIEADKPVFHAEYNPEYKSGEAYEQLCTHSFALGFQTLILPLSLDDSFRIACD